MLLLSAPVMAQDVTAEDPMNAMIARFLSQRKETVGDTVIKVNTDTVFFDVSRYPVTNMLTTGNLSLPRPIGYIRTNLLADAALIPNAGFEITLGRSYRWTSGGGCHRIAGGASSVDGTSGLWPRPSRMILSLAGVVTSRRYSSDPSPWAWRRDTIYHWDTDAGLSTSRVP